MASLSIRAWLSKFTAQHAWNAGISSTSRAAARRHCHSLKTSRSGAPQPRRLLPLALPSADSAPSAAARALAGATPISGPIAAGNGRKVELYAKSAAATIRDYICLSNGLREPWKQLYRQQPEWRLTARCRH